jgi:hypothetical protein
MYIFLKQIFEYLSFFKGMSKFLWFLEGIQCVPNFLQGKASATRCRAVHADE